jgi:hypothetical protein
MIGLECVFPLLRNSWVQEYGLLVTGSQRTAECTRWWLCGWGLPCNGQLALGLPCWQVSSFLAYQAVPHHRGGCAVLAGHSFVHCTALCLCTAQLGFVGFAHAMRVWPIRGE